MGLSNIPYTMAFCLTLTIIIETIIAIIIGVKEKRDLLIIILAQIVTNPIVVTVPYLVYMLYGYEIYKVSIYVLEVLAFITEGYIYYKSLNYKKINPFVLSLVLNLISYTSGLIIFR